MNKRKYEKVGEFKIGGDMMIVTDPCYEKGGYGTKTVKTCESGTYTAFVNKNKYFFTYEGKKLEDCRVASLFAAQGSAENVNPTKIFGRIHCYLREEDGEQYYQYFFPESWKLLSENIGVDSGQAGFFDYEKYGDSSQFATEGIHRYGDAWYNNCCDATLDENDAGIIAECGVNARSGFGDGCYTVFGHQNSKGKYDAFVLFFLADDEPKE